MQATNKSDAVQVYEGAVKSSKIGIKEGLINNEAFYFCMVSSCFIVGMSIVSANDATVALAEYISKDEKEFVKLMNEKAKKLGLKNTNFKNPTGLDEEGHFSSAYDLALLAKELLKHEEIFRFSSKYEDYIRTNTPNKYWLVNTNKLVRFYEGADGLKTGFTDNAGYTISATAKKDFRSAPSTRTTNKYLPFHLMAPEFKVAFI